jgi:hypothetical protein
LLHFFSTRPFRISRKGRLFRIRNGPWGGWCFQKIKKKAASAEQGPQTSVMSAGLRTAKKYSGQVTRRNEEKPKTPRSM